VLDLKPVPIKNFGEDLAQRDRETVPTLFDTWVQHFTSAENYEAIKSIILRRLSASPFLKISQWPLSPSEYYYGEDDIDLPDSEFWEKIHQTITEFGGAAPYRQSYSVSVLKQGR
jgi:hypothetical protein